MKALLAYARIQSEKGRDLAGIHINLEMYMIGSKRWVEIAEGETDAKGYWSVSYKETENLVTAPALRIVEAGIPEPRVLGFGGVYSYSSSKQVLRVDFGVIEHLSEIYFFTAANYLFKRTKHTIAGIFKRQQARREVVAKTLLDARTGGVLTDTDESILALSRSDLTENELSALVAARKLTNNLLASSATGSTGTTGTTDTQTDSAIDSNGEKTTDKLAGTTLTDATTNIGDAYTLEFLKLKAREVDLQNQLNQKITLEAERAEQITIANARIINLESQLADTTTEKDNLKVENENLVKTASRKTDIQDIAFNIGSQIDEANKKMAADSRPYKLGTVNLNLRGVIGDDGQSMTLANAIDLDKANVANSLAGVKLELIPESTPPPADTQIKVPNVTGLTETAVRRLLQAVGLRIETASKSVSQNSDVPIGQSIQQSPTANSNASRGETVLVVFASQ